MTPIPLGFVNISSKTFNDEDKEVTHHTVMACSRIPNRQFKIGLTRSNLRMRPWTNTNRPPLTSQCVTDMYHNKYPTYIQAIKKVKLSSKRFPKVQHFMAFCRHFCIDNNNNLYSMFIPQHPIGTVSLVGEVTLKDKYTMFKSQVVESVNG